MPMDANSPRGLAALAGPPIPNIPQPPPSDVPREPPFDISQQPPPPPPPSYRLYDSKRVTLATFLGTPLAGGWLMALNYRRLGQRRQFWTCIILTIVGTGTFFALCALIPDSFPSTPVAAASIFAMSGIARIQAAMIEQHKARGGRLGSLWEAAGVGLVPLVLIGGVICVFVFQEMNRYSKFTFRVGEEVLYEEQATAADAQKLAE